MGGASVVWRCGASPTFIKRRPLLRSHRAVLPALFAMVSRKLGRENPWVLLFIAFISTSGGSCTSRYDT